LASAVVAPSFSSYFSLLFLFLLISSFYAAVVDAALSPKYFSFSCSSARRRVRSRASSSRTASSSRLDAEQLPCINHIRPSNNTPFARFHSCVWCDLIRSKTHHKHIRTHTYTHTHTHAHIHTNTHSKRNEAPGAFAIRRVDG
jgi:hypothetical protein